MNKRKPLVDVYPQSVVQRDYGSGEPFTSGRAIDKNFGEQATAINALNERVKQMEELYWWIVDTHPEVIERFITTKAVIERMESGKTVGNGAG